MADEDRSTYRVFPRYLANKEYNEYYDRKEQEARDFAERFSEYEDPNYKPKSIMEQFAIDPNYMDEGQPSLPILRKPGRNLNNFDSSTFKDKKTGKEIFPSIPGGDSAVSDEAALISAFAKTQADKVRKKTANEKTKADEEKAKTEKEKFVRKDTVLGRIFDKRVGPGEEISNLAKTNAMLRNISDNLLERRVVGGKEGTDTLSRILGPGGGLREGFDEIEALETASESKKAAAVDKALERRKKQLDYDTGLANIAKTYYDMSGNADATTLQKNAEYAAQMAVSAGQIGADETAAFISQYLRLDQIGANVLASQLESLQQQIFTADPDEQEAIKQQIADINNQIKIRGSGQSTGTTENNDIPYGSLLE